IAREQHRVGEAGDVRQRTSGATLDRKDRLRREPRTRAVPLPAAAELAPDPTERPRDHRLGVVSDRFLEVDPGLRQAREIDGQYQWLHVGGNMPVAFKATAPMR